MRLAARQEDAPMIEPLVPEEVSISAGCLLCGAGSGTRQRGGDLWNSRCSGLPRKLPGKESRWLKGAGDLSLRWS